MLDASFKQIPRTRTGSNRAHLVSFHARCPRFIRSSSISLIRNIALFHVTYSAFRFPLIPVTISLSSAFQVFISEPLRHLLSSTASLGGNNSPYLYSHFILFCILCSAMNVRCFFAVFRCSHRRPVFPLITCKLSWTTADLCSCGHHLHSPTLSSHLKGIRSTDHRAKLFPRPKFEIGMNFSC